MITKPEDPNKIYVEEEYLVIRPINSNDIFNRVKYNVKTDLVDENGIKQVVIRHKEKDVDKQVQ